VAKTQEQLRDDLRAFIGFTKVGLGMAKTKNPKAAGVQFAIVVKNEDGSGQIAASFDCEEFLADLETLVGLGG
jgi:cyclophilin family peptidyl-prolyl cis-trans isomerase